MSDQWAIYDCRTGRRLGRASYPTEALAIWQIEDWTLRDANGGRPDISKYIPHMVARRVSDMEPRHD